MTIDIKHKHASHVIIIEGQAFKANDRGQWDLTDIWRTLKLPKGKQPGQWRTKSAERLERMQFLHALNNGRSGSMILASKRATIEYAGWVSDEFKDMVYDAFEAILERPEVALIVAGIMTDIGHDHSAAILERTTENQDRNSILRGLNRSRKPRTLSPGEKAMRAAMGVAKRHEKANPIR
ncbi:hypothetical protein BZK31_18165 [Pseudomonas floridensis]|uniref:Uncharacterized protein n=1 Tax=Pseudomonas floridensis TaxID=1958950 RepID=A0A1X0N4E7_9PSED|nr:hypothetical protein [Pseudomonas floridensis]ORC57765.1 hypothetical protein BZK31_18165 [Pseudomonas floridensis]